MENKPTTIKVNADFSEVEKGIALVNQLCDKLKEAKSLADEIASLNLEISLNA